jgi:hypothetical protein
MRAEARAEVRGNLTATLRLSVEAELIARRLLSGDNFPVEGNIRLSSARLFMSFGHLL